MPYMLVCKIDPDDNKFHDPKGERTVCGKKVAEKIRTGTDGISISSKDACVLCFHYLKGEI